MEKKRSQFLNMVSQKASTSDHITKVLLVCVYNKSGTLITHDIFYRLFSKYGEVQRILIFQKSKVWKTFLEMDTIESAIEAKRMLHNHVLFEDGSRMKIFFSNLDIINFQNNNSGGVDYSVIKTRITNISFLMKEKDNILQNSDIIQNSSFHSQNGENSTVILQEAQQMLIRPQQISQSQQQQQAMSSSIQEFPTTVDNSSDEEHKIINSANQIDNYDILLYSDEDQEIQNLQQNIQDRKNQNFCQQQQKSMTDFKKNLDQSLQKLDQLLDNLDLKNPSQTDSMIPQPAKSVTVSAMQEVYPISNLQLSHTQNSSLLQSQSHSTFDSDRIIEHRAFRPTPLLLSQTQCSSSNVNVKAGSISPQPQPQQQQHQMLLLSKQTQQQQQQQLRQMPSPTCTGNNNNNLLLLCSTPPLGPQQQQQQQLGTPTTLNGVKTTTPTMNTSTSTPPPKNQQQQQQQSSNNNGAQVFATDPSTYVNPLFLLENRKSPVIYIRGLDSPAIKIEWLMNLFMNFGNVTKICFMHEKLAALIEFEEVDFATQAKDFLNGTSFMGNTLKIFYSNYASIDARKGQSRNEEVLLGLRTRFRFQLENKPYSINPPSQILHISGLRAEACNYEVIVNLFSSFGNIEAVKFLVKDTYKHMCLVKFGSMEESFQAMAEMQGKEICGRRILLSFTRSKI